MERKESDEKMKDFDYWIGLTFSDGSNVPPREREFYLTTLKEKYIKSSFENMHLSGEVSNLSEKTLQLDIEVEGLKKINSELTEENSQVTEDLIESKEIIKNLLSHLPTKELLSCESSIFKDIEKAEKFIECEVKRKWEI